MTLTHPVPHETQFAANLAPVTQTRPHDDTHAHVVRSVSPGPGMHARTAMHPGVYKVALLCWVFFLGVFWITFSVNGNAMFMVAVSTFYAIVFFTVPYIFSRIAKVPATVPFSLSAFLRGRFDTIDGPIGGGEALLQVILVPLALGTGGVIIGFIIRAARHASGL